MQAERFQPCILIPIYNNEHTIGGVVESLASHGLHCLIIDDGSNAGTRGRLDEIEAAHDWVAVHHRAGNGGKGAAMADGFRIAAQQGFSHAIQIDADGQHDAADVPRFVAAAREHPAALILGRPVFASDAPAARRYGRMVTNFWVCLETLSTDIGDALYGFRCYPLEPVTTLYATTQIGPGMVFDTEIAVRLFWRGVPMVNLDTRVHYARDGVSHFDYLRDNLRLSGLHLRLLAGMLWRLPVLLTGRRRH